MIKTINAADDVDDKWIMCCPYKGRFHMFGETGAYNIKFISSNNTDNIYEAVYDKDGNLITENDDNGKNMGTYNYASSSKDAGTHNEFDVKTYKNWGNTPLDPPPIKRSWNDNVTYSWRDCIEYCEPRLKEYYIPNVDVNIARTIPMVDHEAVNHYINVCEQIGIVYYVLLVRNFSDRCY